MGYEYARCDSPEDRTQKPPKNPEQDIYRHPGAQGNVSTSFKREFDIYSLGLVLMEIAKWKPLKHIVRDVLNIKKCLTEDIERLKGSLLDHKSSNFLPDVSFRAGSIYGSVVEARLSSFSSPTGDTNSLDQLQDLYVSRVIKALEKCRI
jgi:hypothetical protein